MLVILNLTRPKNEPPSLVKTAAGTSLLPLLLADGRGWNWEKLGRHCGGYEFGLHKISVKSSLSSFELGQDLDSHVL